MIGGDDPQRLDRDRVRLSFERAAATYDAAAVLQREVGQRMAERMDMVRLAPERLLDAGCGTGESLSELALRYPAAARVGLDLAFNMTLAARARSIDPRSLLVKLFAPGPARQTAPVFVCGDISRLPLAAASFDLVWSNLALQWVNDLGAALLEVHRVLRVGGLFTFTSFGPDTLKELRSAFAGNDDATHTNRFLDMHDVGDMLVGSRFADPVMDMEQMTLTYADAHSMLRELKAIGAHNATAGRRRTLTGRERFARVLAALERTRREGRLPATFEIIYGHAWKPEPRVTPEGHPIVRMSPRPPRSA